MIVMMIASTPSLNASSRDFFMCWPTRRRSCFAQRQLRALCLPLCARLTPHLDREICKRGRQSRHSEHGRTKTPGNCLGIQIVWRDRVYDFGPAQLRKCPVDRGHGALSRIATPPVLPADAPANLGAGPAFGAPGPKPADPFAAGPVKG